MQLITRSFAGVLWLCALVPVALYFIHLSSPEAATRGVMAVGSALRWMLLGGAVAATVALVIYPPFLPGVRLSLRRLRTRLGTNLAPLREAEGRLQHFQTPADHLTAGRVLFQQGRLREALPHLVAAIELDPRHAGARYQLGLALIQARQLQGAAEQLAAAVQIDADHAFGNALLELGVVLERGNAGEQAVEALQRHTAKFGPDRRAMLHQARALTRLDRRDEAVELLRQAAQPPEDGRSMTLENQLARSQARVALLSGGRL